MAPYTFNAQQQQRIDWPAHPVIARAYLDQLGRSDTIATEQSAAVTEILDRLLGVEPGNGASTAEELDTMADELTLGSATASGQNQARFRALVETVQRLAESLR